jgi:hypothetical protein
MPLATGKQNMSGVRISFSADGTAAASNMANVTDISGPKVSVEMQEDWAMGDTFKAMVPCSLAECGDVTLTGMLDLADDHFERLVSCKANGTKITSLSHVWANGNKITYDCYVKEIDYDANNKTPGRSPFKVVLTPTSVPVAAGAS